MPRSKLGALPSFQTGRGFTMVDGTDITKFFNMIIGSAGGLIAHAGGGIPLATQLSDGFNSVDTVVTIADSLMLPPAITSGWSWIFNGGAASTTIYNQQANVNNNGVTDVIIPHGSPTPNAGTAGIALASGACTLFVCVNLGVWKQVGVFV